jgi:hypothetical protein
MKSRDTTLAFALCAFLVHALVISLSLLPGWRAQPLIGGDAITYLLPAQSLVDHGVFSRDQEPPFLWEPYRTPTYPLMITVSLLFTGACQWTLYFAAVTAALAAFSAVRIVRMWGGTRSAEVIAACIVCFMPNSLGLSAQLLTDAIVGHLFIVWLLVTLIALSSSSRLHSAASVAILAILQGLKPTFSIAFILIVLMGLLYAISRFAWAFVLAAIFVSMIVPGALSLRNMESHGVFAPTLLSADAIREYLMVRHLQETTGEDYTTLTNRVRDEDRVAAEKLSNPPSKYGRLYRIKSEKAKTFLREHPFAALRLMATEMLQQFAAPQEFFPQVFVGDLPNWGRGLGSLLSLTLWGCAALGGYTLWKQGNKAPALMTAGVLLFFLLTGSVSHAVGARLRFPADMAAVPLMGVGVARLLQGRFVKL